jgi:hypothetical protein
LACRARAAKARFVENGQICQYLAVDLDLRFAEPVHESAVLHPEFPGRRVDTGYPETAELAFALATVAVSVLPGLHDRLLGDTVYVVAAAAVTFGQGENFLVARVRGYTTF